MVSLSQNDRYVSDANFEQAKNREFGDDASQRGRKKVLSSMDEEEEPDVDEDGNPLTIEAAKRIFHKDNNRLYFKTQRFKSFQQASK